MASKSNPAKKRGPKGSATTRRRVTTVVDESGPVVDPGLAQESDEVAEWYEAIFDDYSADKCLVQLSRTAPVDFPEIENYSVGFLATVRPVSNHDYEGMIAREYGGGTYRFVRRSAETGRIEAYRTVTIEGHPKPLAIGRGAPGGAGGTNPLARSGSVVEIEGAEIDMASNLDDLTAFVTKIKAIKDLFRDPVPPPPIDIEIMKLVMPMLGRGFSGGDDLDRLITLQSKMEALRPSASPAGDGWQGIVTEAIRQAGNVLSSGGVTPRRPARPAPALPAAPVSEVTDNPNGGTVVAENKTNEEERPMPTRKEMAMAAVGQIAAGYLEEPRSSYSHVIKCIDFVVPLAGEVRAEIAADYGDVLRSLSWQECQSHIDESVSLAEAKVEFDSYFDAVLAEWSEATRVVSP